MVHRQLIEAVRTELRAEADPSKALAMQAYMKSAMPYLGVQTAPQRRIYARVFKEHPIDATDSWRQTVLALWREAAFREERYAAVALSGHRAYEPWQTLDTIPMYEELIVTGAWWDYVDALAAHRIGPLFRSHPRPMTRLMRTWSRDADRWKRRTSILCQLTFKERTDRALLYACIEPNLGDRDFFIRKAIGWALRQYAYVDPREVARYVCAREGELSPLSRREALKHIG